MKILSPTRSTILLEGYISYKYKTVKVNVHYWFQHTYRGSVSNYWFDDNRFELLNKNVTVRLYITIQNIFRSFAVQELGLSLYPIILKRVQSYSSQRHRQNLCKCILLLYFVSLHLSVHPVSMKYWNCKSKKISSTYIPPVQFFYQITLSKVMILLCCENFW